MLSFDRLTVKAGEAIQEAASGARRRGAPEIEGVHLLEALLHQAEGIVTPVLLKLGAPVPHVNERVTEVLGEGSRSLGVGEGLSSCDRPES